MSLTALTLGLCRLCWLLDSAVSFPFNCRCSQVWLTDLQNFRSRNNIKENKRLMLMLSLRLPVIMLCQSHLKWIIPPPHLAISCDKLDFAFLGLAHTDYCSYSNWHYFRNLLVQSIYRTAASFCISCNGNRSGAVFLCIAVSLPQSKGYSESIFFPSGQYGNLFRTCWCQYH